MSNEHPQAPIYSNNDVVFTVDVKLQALIQYMFDRRIIAFNSSQNNAGGMIWIELSLMDWLAITKNAYTQRKTNDLYYFIEDHCRVALHSDNDGCLDEEKNEWIEGDNVIWDVCIRFPNTLLTEFEKQIMPVLDMFPLLSDSDGR
jgi:hypothetical protein